MALFRSEVIQAQRRRLFGEVTIHQPVAFTVLTSTIVVATVAGLVFIGTARFSKKESVKGTIVPEAGLAEVVASRAGVVSDISIEIGEVVRAGTTLATITADLAGVRGDLNALQESQTRTRLAELNIQIASKAAQAVDERSRLLSKAEAIEQGAARLQISHGYQLEQLRLAEKQFESIGPLVTQGYMSGLERDRRAQAVLLQRQAVEEASAAIEAREADVADLRAQAAAIPGRAASEQSQLRAARSQLEQGLDELDAQGRTLVRAPLDGRVTAVNLHVGAPVTAGSPMLTIAPLGSPLQAEVFIPTQAAGFVAEGQPVRLMVDAFPYQRFGVVRGVIARVHRSPVALAADSAASPAPRSAYRAWVKIAEPSVIAYGERRPLQAGMAVTADVVTTRQTVLQMLLDPLFSMRRLGD